MNEAVTLDENSFQEQESPDNRFNDYQHAKVLIQAYQRDIADYRRMKQEGKEKGISDRKKRRYNREIENLREEIQDLEEKL